MGFLTLNVNVSGKAENFPVTGISSVSWLIAEEGALAQIHPSWLSQGQITYGEVQGVSLGLLNCPDHPSWGWGAG